MIVCITDKKSSCHACMINISAIPIGLLADVDTLGEALLEEELLFFADGEDLLRKASLSGLDAPLPPPPLLEVLGILFSVALSSVI